jgi:hypothetical protein
MKLSLFRIKMKKKFSSKFYGLKEIINTYSRVMDPISDIFYKNLDYLDKKNKNKQNFILILFYQ